MPKQPLQRENRGMVIVEPLATAVEAFFA